jgi:RHS repeat-associated protein
MPYRSMHWAVRPGALFFFVIALQLLGLPLISQAGNCPPNSCCRDDTAHGSPKACVGNPINLVSGNKYQVEADMPALPGVLGLELVRHYNSESSRVLPAGADGKGRNDNISVLGRGWRLSYDRHITWQGDGSPRGDLMTLTEGDGRQLLFTRSLRHALVFEGRGEAAGQIIRVRPADERARLPAHVGWRFEWLARGGIGGGLREHFDARGWMVARMAPTGEVLNIRRNTIGWPLKVTDPNGREMVLHYLSNQARAASRQLPPGQQQFSGVQHIDTPVGRFSYQYGGPGPAGTRVPAVELVANLRAVVQPGNVTRHYHYEDPRWPTLLSGISVQATTASAQRPAPTQRIVTWLYDNRGRAVLSVHGAPARLQRNAQGQPIKPAQLVAGTGIDQVFLSWPKPNQAVIINALGQRTQYQMANIAGQLRVVEARGPGCPSCTPGNTRWRYNDAGQVLEQTRITPQGQAIEGLRWQYDASGRMVAEQAVHYSQGTRTGIHTSTGQPTEQVQDLAHYTHAYRRDQDHLGRPVLSSVAPQIITRPSVVPGKQQETHIRYNDRGQPLQITHKGWRPAIEPGQVPQAIEHSTTYQYQLVNGRSVLTQVDGPLPNGPTNSPIDSDITRYTWDGRGSHLVSMATPQGTSQITYDKAGRVASVSSERATTRWTYQGQQLSEVEQSQPGWPAQKQNYAYDALGRMTEKAGQIKREFDSAGRLLWQASAMGVLETNQWDALGQLTQTKRLTNAITQENNYAYDAQGRITQLSDNQGRVMRIAYDDRGRPSLMADQSGRVLDLSSAPTASATAANTPMPQQWRDDFGRVVATRSPDHGLRTQQYDAANRLTAMRDALGNRAQYQYDARGRIVKQVVEPGAKSGSAIQTTWRYEGDHLAALTHPTQSEQYSYDERGLCIGKTITRKTHAGMELTASQTAVTRYAYNEQGQLIGSSLPDGSWISYARNGQGQVVALKRSPIHPHHLRWLAWLLPEQTIAQDFERDMVGLRSYTQGNGLQTRHYRSQAGVLARVHVSKPIEVLSKTEQAKAADRLLQMLGIQAAMAQQAKTSNQVSDPFASLGALGIKPDPQALIDHRYLWDTRGNLLYTRSGAQQNEVRTYAYDGANRLVVSVASQGQAKNLKEHRVDRYFYQGSKRVLQQQNATAQSDIHTNTLRLNHREGTHQWTGATDAESANSYDEAGQPTRLGQRSFKWDAYGRLSQVSDQANKLTASYTYNHRGERIHKTVGHESTAYLYDDSRQLQAELNSQGHITRQYIYLANMPLAMIDTPEGASLEEPRSGLSETLHELGQVIAAWFSSQGEITYLHTNHLGAVEAATNAQGQVIWQAAYEPFGKAHVQTHGASKAFALNLRLPGQYEDTETGLFYNDHRYHDPDRGEYISPDPLGHPDGANPYAYVAHNPLNAIDPLGLILFAFDGTNNSAPPPSYSNGKQDDISNVRKFYLAYDQEVNGQKWYMNGVGRDDPESGIKALWQDDKDAVTARSRVNYMLKQFDQYMLSHKFTDTDQVNIDIVGFSRGAAMARDFANRMVSNLNKSPYIYSDGKSCKVRQVNFRFLGLWDTVAQFGANGGANSAWQLDIPESIQNVYHAVAMNEHRELFPSEGIRRGIEKGFLGSHADIGGSYVDGDLSDVALNWIVEMAKKNKVMMSDWGQNGTNKEWGVISNPLVHDKNTDGGDRDYYLRKNNSGFEWGTDLSDVTIGGITSAESAKWISRYTKPNLDGDGISPIVGKADMESYSKWLEKNYNLKVTYTDW